MSLTDTIQKRRSVYALGDQPALSDARIREIVETALRFNPSPYNVRSARVLLLFGFEHRRWWDLVRNGLRESLQGDFLERALARIDGFAHARGTVLFFEDKAAVDALCARFPDNADRFPLWSLQSSGMLQFTVWTALAEQGVGASLQHYGEMVRGRLRDTWDLSDSWVPIAQLPFGNIEAAPDPRDPGDPKTALKVAGQE